MTTAVLGDCMEVMRGLGDGAFDLAICDPPYFWGPNRRGFYGAARSALAVRRAGYPKTEAWDVVDALYMAELRRVSRHQIVWGVNYLDFNPGPGRIVWDKVNGATSYSDCEIAYCSLHDSVRQFRFMWNGMCQGKSVAEGHVMQGNKRLNQQRIHPTEKPYALYHWLLRKYAEPGWKILDTHLGSGSHRIVADALGFEFLGIEADVVHFHNQELRFRARREHNLFSVQ